MCLKSTQPIIVSGGKNKKKWELEWMVSRGMWKIMLSLGSQEPITLGRVSENPSSQQRRHQQQTVQREHILPEGQDSLCSGKKRVPIFSLTRVTVRLRQGLKLKIKHSLRSCGSGWQWGASVRGLGTTQWLLRTQSVQGRGWEKAFLW